MLNFLKIVQVEKSKIAYLDGLRGLAALAVFIDHYLVIFYPARSNGDPAISHSCFDLFLFKFPLSFFYNGLFAVSIFFVLSGYVLTKAYFVKNDEQILIKRALARYPRLCLPVTTSIIFVFILINFGLYKIKDVAIITGREEVLSFSKLFMFAHPIEHLIKNALLTTWIGGETIEGLFNLVLWTIPIEFQGSLLVLSFALFINRVKYKEVFALLIASTLLIGCKPNGVHYVAFIAGTLLASYKIKPTLGIQRYFVLIGAIGALLLSGVSSTPLDKVITYFTSPDKFYQTVAAIILIYCLLGSVALQKFLSQPLFVFLGYISFPLYLIHQPIIYSVCSLLFLHFYKLIGYNQLVLLISFIYIALTFPLAVIMRQTVDQASVDLSHRFSSFVVRKVKE